MKKTILLIPLFFSLLCSGCASFGPTIVIETPEPAEDFVVICEWYKMPFLEFHGGSKVSKQTVHVTESGKELDCGIAWSGGKANALVHHPIYRHPDIVERDGLTVYQYTKTALDILDEQKAKFEAGEWDEHRWPGSEYANSVKGLCWFPYQYFEYYKQEKKVSVEYFKSRYYESILECYKRVIPILKQYDKSYRNIASPEEYVKGFWDPDKWEQFND